jgi:hypothetical protein
VSGSSTLLLGTPQPGLRRPRSRSALSWCGEAVRQIFELSEVLLVEEPFRLPNGHASRGRSEIERHPARIGSRASRARPPPHAEQSTTRSIAGIPAERPIRRTSGDSILDVPFGSYRETLTRGGPVTVLTGSRRRNRDAENHRHSHSRRRSRAGRRCAGNPAQPAADAHGRDRSRHFRRAAQREHEAREWRTGQAEDQGAGRAHHTENRRPGPHSDGTAIRART